MLKTSQDYQVPRGWLSPSGRGPTRGIPKDGHIMAIFMHFYRETGHQPWDFSGTPFFDSLIWVKIKQITMRQQRQTHSRNSRHVFLFQQWWASASCNISCQIYSLTTVCDKYIQLRYCVNCICIWYYIKVQLCFFLWFNAENIKPSVSTFLVTCRSACWKHHRFLMHVACCCMWQ